MYTEVVNNYNLNRLLNKIKEDQKMSVMIADKMVSVFDGKESIYSHAQEKGKEEIKLAHIVNDTPLDFNTTIERSLTTTTELAMQINEVFKAIFSDWYGSEVKVDGNNNLIAVFTFKAAPGQVADDKRAFLPISDMRERSSNKMLDRIMSINMMNASNHHNMEITPYGAELLYDVMSFHMKNNIKVNPVDIVRPYVGETFENVGYGTAQNIYNTVIGIDIYKVLGVVFGTRKTSNPGDHYIYNIRAMRPVDYDVIMQCMTNNGIVTPPSANYILEIERMTNNRFRSAMAKLGKTPIPGAITAITGSISDLKR